MCVVQHVVRQRVKCVALLVGFACGLQCGLGGAHVLAALCVNTLRFRSSRFRSLRIESFRLALDRHVSDRIGSTCINSTRLECFQRFLKSNLCGLRLYLRCNRFNGRLSTELCQNSQVSSRRIVLALLRWAQCRVVDARQLF